MSCCWNNFFVTIVIVLTCIQHNSVFCTGSCFLYFRCVFMFVVFFNWRFCNITFALISAFIICIYMCMIFTTTVTIITYIYTINIFPILIFSTTKRRCFPSANNCIWIIILIPCRKLNSINFRMIICNITLHSIPSLRHIYNFYIWNNRNCSIHIYPWESTIFHISSGIIGLHMYCIISFIIMMFARLYIATSCITRYRCTLYCIIPISICIWPYQKINISYFFIIIHRTRNFKTIPCDIRNFKIANCWGCFVHIYPPKLTIC